MTFRAELAAVGRVPFPVVPTKEPEPGRLCPDRELCGDAEPGFAALL